MSAWQPISSVPLKTRVLLYWSIYEHVEDGMFVRVGEYQLFDGEAMLKQPSHWMPFPEVPK